MNQANTIEASHKKRHKNESSNNLLKEETIQAQILIAEVER